MMGSHGSNLRQVGDGNNLTVQVAHLCHDFRHLFSSLTAYSRVDFIKDDGWQFYGAADHGLQRKHDAGDFSTRSNLTHRLEKRALIGAEQEIYLVNTIRTERLGGE